MLDLHEESLPKSQRTKTRGEKKLPKKRSAQKTKPSPVSAVFEPLRINPVVDPSFPPATYISNCQFDELYTNPRMFGSKLTLNPFRSFREHPLSPMCCPLNLVKPGKPVRVYI